MPLGRRREAEPSALAVMGSLFLLGLLYGLGEYARQAWWVPSPAGIPGDGGGSLLGHLALGLSTVTLPGLVVGWLLRRIRWWPDRLRWFAVFFAAMVPTTLLALDRLFEFTRWPWTQIEVGGSAYYLRLLLAALVVLVVPAVVFAWVRPLRRMPGLVGVLLVVATVVAPGWLVFELSPSPVTTGRGPIPPKQAPSVLLVTIDTLRQDALAPYGGPVELPEALADARVFDGWSVSSWTQPAMASLFTAVAPTGHGSDPGHAPSPDVAWWVEPLRDAGWTTGAVVTNPFMRRRFGFDRGFAHYDHAEELEHLEPIARTLWAEWWQTRVVDRGEPDRGDRRVDRAEAWLGDLDPERPFFLWVHLIDPHLPYHLRGEDGALHPTGTPEWVAPIAPLLEDGAFELLVETREGLVVTTEEQRRALHRLYLGEVDFAMHAVGRLVARARDVARASGRDLVWALTSDHGEEFWEDGGFEHGHSFHDTVVRVPFLVGGAGAERVGFNAFDRIRLTDAGPMLLDLLGVEGFDPRATSGLIGDDGEFDALALGRSERPEEGLPVLVEGILYGPSRSLVVGSGGRALERIDDTRELLVQRRWGDESDTTSVAQLESLFLRLDLWRERNADRGAVIEMDADLERRLRAVGYVQ